MSVFELIEKELDHLKIPFVLTCIIQEYTHDANDICLMFRSSVMNGRLDELRKMIKLYSFVHSEESFSTYGIKNSNRTLKERKKPCDHLSISLDLFSILRDAYLSPHTDVTRWLILNFTFELDELLKRGVLIEVCTKSILSQVKILAPLFCTNSSFNSNPSQKRSQQLERCLRRVIECIFRCHTLLDENVQVLIWIFHYFRSYVSISMINSIFFSYCGNNKVRAVSEMIKGNLVSSPRVLSSGAFTALISGSWNVLDWFFEKDAKIISYTEERMRQSPSLILSWSVNVPEIFRKKWNLQLDLNHIF